MRAKFCGALAGGLAAATVAFAQTDSQAPPTPSETKPAVLQVVDARPAKERLVGRKAYGGSGWIGSCDFAVASLNETLVPGRIDLLRSQIEQALAGRQIGLVQVDHYHVYLNARDETLAGARVAASGSVGILTSERVPLTLQPACARDQMKGGWFEPAELTNNFSPFIVEIEASIEGRKYSARAAGSPPRRYPLAPHYYAKTAFRSPEEAEFIRALMSKANTALIAAIVEAEEAPPR